MKLTSHLILLADQRDLLHRTLLFLQLIVQVQSRMSRDDSSSNSILRNPEHVLTFIKHALQSDTRQDTASKQASVDPSPPQGLSMDDLRIVPEEDPDDDSDAEGDSDDETSSPQGVRSNDEMTVTALNLLLSILEGASFVSKRPRTITHYAHQQIRPSPRGRPHLSKKFSSMPSVLPRRPLSPSVHSPAKCAWCSQCISRLPRLPLRDRLVSPREIAYDQPTKERSSFSKTPFSPSGHTAYSFCANW